MEKAVDKGVWQHWQAGTITMTHPAGTHLEAEGLYRIIVHWLEVTL